MRKLIPTSLELTLAATTRSPQSEQILRDAGLMVKRRLDFASNAYFAEAPEGSGQHVFAIAEKLLERAEVIYCHP